MKDLALLILLITLVAIAAVLAWRRFSGRPRSATSLWLGFWVTWTLGLIVDDGWSVSIAIGGILIGVYFCELIEGGGPTR